VPERKRVRRGTGETACQVLAPSAMRVLTSRWRGGGPVRSEGWGTPKSGISTWEELLNWEELLDLWREFGPPVISIYAYRALPNVNPFQVNLLEQSARRSLVWHDTCEASGNLVTAPQTCGCGSVGTDGGYS
jgi:hypothetical protein